MIIKVRLFFTLRQYLNVEHNFQDGDGLEVPNGETAAGLLERLNIPQEKVGIIFVNGCPAEKSQVLKGGDTVAVFPPMVAGG